jgi:hypothetical protein
MPKFSQTVRVNVVVEMSATSLQTIVETAKNLVGQNQKGHYRVDTADWVGEMISRFLADRNFEGFVEDVENYR